MKLPFVFAIIALWIDSASSIVFRSKQPAHQDNFQEEILDQADPEFDMASYGDDCINLTDAEQPIREAWQTGSLSQDSIDGDDARAANETQEELLADLKIHFDHVDLNHDGCINKTEYHLAGEMEGPPPGYQKEMIDEMGEDAFEEKMEDEERFEFQSMDRNGDGKISASEAYHYTDENLPNADLSQQDLQEMFENCDINRDKFLDYEEFTECGGNHEGDGNEMEDAEPMALKIFKLKHKDLVAHVKAKKAGKSKHTRLSVIKALFRLPLRRRLSRHRAMVHRRQRPSFARPRPSFVASGSSAAVASKWDWKALESFGSLQKVIWTQQAKNPAFSEETCKKLFAARSKSGTNAIGLFAGCSEVCAKAKEVKKRWGVGGTGPLACEKFKAFGCPDEPKAAALC